MSKSIPGRKVAKKQNVKRTILGELPTDQKKLSRIPVSGKLQSNPKQLPKQTNRRNLKSSVSLADRQKAEGIGLDFQSDCSALDIIMANDGGDGIISAPSKPNRRQTYAAPKASDAIAFGRRVTKKKNVKNETPIVPPKSRKPVLGELPPDPKQLPKQTNRRNPKSSGSLADQQKAEGIGLDFEADVSALQSILDNEGIVDDVFTAPSKPEHRQTYAGPKASGFKPQGMRCGQPGYPVDLPPPRQSIYYRPNRNTSSTAKVYSEFSQRILSRLTLDGNHANRPKPSSVSAKENTAPSTPEYRGVQVLNQRHSIYRTTTTAKKMKQMKEKQRQVGTPKTPGIASRVAVPASPALMTARRMTAQSASKSAYKKQVKWKNVLNQDTDEHNEEKDLVATVLTFDEDTAVQTQPEHTLFSGSDMVTMGDSHQGDVGCTSHNNEDDEDLKRIKEIEEIERLLEMEIKQMEVAQNSASPQESRVALPTAVGSSQVPKPQFMETDDVERRHMQRTASPSMEHQTYDDFNVDRHGQMVNSAIYVPEPLVPAHSVPAESVPEQSLNQVVMHNVPRNEYFYYLPIQTQNRDNHSNLDGLTISQRDITGQISPDKENEYFSTKNSNSSRKYYNKPDNSQENENVSEPPRHYLKLKKHDSHSMTEEERVYEIDSNRNLERQILSTPQIPMETDSLVPVKPEADGHHTLHVTKSPHIHRLMSDANSSLSADELNQSLHESVVQFDALEIQAKDLEKRQGKSGNPNQDILAQLEAVKKQQDELMKLQLQLQEQLNKQQKATMQEDVKHKQQAYNNTDISSYPSDAIASSATTSQSYNQCLTIPEVTCFSSRTKDANPQFKNKSSLEKSEHKFQEIKHAESGHPVDSETNTVTNPTQYNALAKCTSSYTSQLPITTPKAWNQSATPKAGNQYIYNPKSLIGDNFQIISGKSLGNTGRNVPNDSKFDLAKLNQGQVYTWKQTGTVGIVTPRVATAKSQAVNTPAPLMTPLALRNIAQSHHGNNPTWQSLIKNPSPTNPLIGSKSPSYPDFDQSPVLLQRAHDAKSVQESYQSRMIPGPGVPKCAFELNSPSIENSQAHSSQFSVNQRSLSSENKDNLSENHMSLSSEKQPSVFTSNIPTNFLSPSSVPSIHVELPNCSTTPTYASDYFSGSLGESPSLIQPPMGRPLPSPALCVSSPAGHATVPSPSPSSATTWFSQSPSAFSTQSCTQPSNITSGMTHTSPAYCTSPMIQNHTLEMLQTKASLPSTLETPRISPALSAFDCQSSTNLGSLSFNRNLSTTPGLATCHTSPMLHHPIPDRPQSNISTISSGPVFDYQTSESPGSLSLNANVSTTPASATASAKSKLSSVLMANTTQRFQDALLDEECALYACRLRTKFTPEPSIARCFVNPVAKILLEGDEMHFVPIREELQTFKSPAREGSAFASYNTR